MRTAGRTKINVGTLKVQAKEAATKLEKGADLNPVIEQLLASNTVAAPAPAPAPVAPEPTGKEKGKK